MGGTETPSSLAPAQAALEEGCSAAPGHKATDKREGPGQGGRSPEASGQSSQRCSLL